ncbi:cytochrome P450 family protein [Salix suchowensis]|nr:cytochrome P450 family protein [Salix suchowensis]
MCGDGSAVIELRTMLLDLNFNIMMRMVAGKKYYGEDVDELEESRRFKNMMQEFTECTRMMLVAGTKTSAMSLEWAFSNMLNNPHVLKKAKDEVDTQVGQDRLLDEPDFSNLHYIQCIIHENLRICPPAPLLVPHVASERCSLGGYDIPSGRRGCPGEAMALRVINLVMGQLLQCFEFTTADGKEVDMTETAATLMVKITPLELICKARPNTHNLLA